MAEDNWAHRSDSMRCRTCMWFVVKAPGPLGRCRRRAPTLDGWPVVYPMDWCGDHKLETGVSASSLSEVLNAAIPSAFSTRRDNPNYEGPIR